MEREVLETSAVPSIVNHDWENMEIDKFDFFMTYKNTEKVLHVQSLS